MSAGGIITMIVVLGVVWGGFVYTLRMAIKREQAKKHATET